MAMFVVTEADADAIREVFDRDGELSAAIELRRRFPGISKSPPTRPRLNSPVTSRQIETAADDMVQFQPVLRR
jgi:hypothetical protein